jgi:hypothetical protein
MGGHTLDNIVVGRAGRLSIVQGTLHFSCFATSTLDLLMLFETSIIHSDTSDLNRFYLSFLHPMMTSFMHESTSSLICSLVYLYDHKNKTKRKDINAYGT